MCPFFAKIEEKGRKEKEQKRTSRGVARKNGIRNDDVTLPGCVPAGMEGGKKGGVATSRVRALVRKENAVILESFTHNKGGPANPGGS